MDDALRDLRTGIEALPGMDLILPALEGLPPAYLVGGAVRDLLRGKGTMDLDVAAEGPADVVARALATRLGGEVEAHERFGTATVRTGELSVDLATSRRERYPRPGALPEVEPAPIEEDLGRRDFSVNAMAAPLDAARRGELLDLHGGRDDLAAAVVRVLHPGSFTDDPTRLLRAIRYEARLGLAMDPDTEALARRAVADRVSDTVSGSRIGAELVLLLAEERVEAALARLVDLGLDGALDPALAVDAGLAARAARAARAASATGAVPALAALAALVAAAPVGLAQWLDGLGLSADDRERVARGARSGPSLAATLRRPGDAPLTASALRELLAREPPEALALALVLGAPAEPIARYADVLRFVRLSIDGDDLLSAGVQPSPALGRALAETLRRKLDGQVADRDEELRVALALARGEEDGR
jgi:tRNA nucleotidyltransferase (CCA-adding enzyme)